MVSRATSLDNHDQTLAVSLVFSASGTTLHELRGQVTRSRLTAPPVDLIGPAVTILGVANFGTSTTSPTARALDLAEAIYAVSHQSGQHVLKVGADFLFNALDIDFPGALQGSYTFTNLASFVAGQYSQFQQAFGERLQPQRNPNLGVYAQDEWRPRANVTLTAGLRYDLQWLPAPIRVDANNVSPRLGLAWANADRRILVRANAGLYYDRIPLRAVSNALQRDGEKYTVAVLAPGQSGAPVFPAVATSFPENVLVSITTIDQKIAASRSLTAGGEVERDLGWSVVAAGYQYVRTRGLIMSRNINVLTLSPQEAALRGVPNLGRPDPRYGNIGQFASLGRSRYDGVTLSWAVNRSRGAIRGSYSFGKAFDDAGNFFFSQPQNAGDIGADWGPSDNDQRHRLSLSGRIAGPRAGPGLRQVFGGWEVAAIYGYTSALPFNVLAGVDRNGDTNNNDRPAGVGRNSARGFDFSVLDVRFGRRVTVARATLEVLVEVFNALNRANFLVPNNVFGTGATPRPGFGQPTDAADPRQIQFGLRVGF
jgi:hypothetical protein